MRAETLSMIIYFILLRTGMVNLTRHLFLMGDFFPSSVLECTLTCTLVDVQMIKGFANVFAGGEGLFMTTLTGPGVVWLQGQPPERMISEIARRVPSGGGIGIGVPIGGGGGGEEEGAGGGEQSS